MTLRMLTEEQQIGKICQYEWFEKGMRSICGKQAVAKAGIKPVCREHMMFIQSSYPTPLEKPIIRSKA